MLSRNYQKEMDAALACIKGEGRVPSLLLHSCCAPCSSYVLEYLSEFFRITVFFFNPNIYPESEHQLRLTEQKRLISLINPPNPVDLVEGEYNPGEFEAAVSGLESEPEGGRRCDVCFALRLDETARLCRTGGFDYFATTLTVSPHKNAPLINEIGLRAGNKYGAAYLVSDFKKRGGYQRSIVLSREYGLYRQNFCGCRFSGGDIISK